MILPKNFQQFLKILSSLLILHFYSVLFTVSIGGNELKKRRSNDQKKICNLQLILQMMDLHYACYK